jgi:hypothetical protein
MTSSDLIEIISGKLTCAQLPREWPAHNRGGWGLGQLCAACDATIDAEHLQLEARFPAGETRAFHVRCFVQWWDLVGANGWARRRT